MKFHIQDDDLTISFQGAEAFWALKRRIVVEKKDIVKATWQEAESIPRRELGWRFGGSAVPGVVFAGRFAGNKGLNFLYLLNPKGFFGDIQVKHVLTLQLRHHRYKRLFFTVNKPDIAEQIIGWWSGNV